MKRLVVWGGTDGEDSFRHINRAFHATARKLGIEAHWVPDHERSLPVLTPGTTVICPDVFGHHIGPAVDGVDYVLHNFDGSHILCCTVAPERLLRLQVWTTAASGEVWQPFRQFDREAQTLFQPWGCDLLPSEFLDPVFNPDSIDVTFVGAIWGEESEHGELGNVGVMNDLRSACLSRGLRLKHLTQITDAEMREELRAARVTPALAGEWQVRVGYLPCRVFKLPSIGCLAFTNVAQANRILGAGALLEKTVEGMLDEALSLPSSLYKNLVREQQRAVSRYTYRESLEAIDRAFEEIRP